MKKKRQMMKVKEMSLKRHVSLYCEDRLVNSDSEYHGLCSCKYTLRPQKSKPKVYFCHNFKQCSNFHQIWQVAAAVNAKLCVKAIHFTWHVYTHYLAVLRDRIVTKYCHFK